MQTSTKARKAALKDISEYLKKRYTKTDNQGDIWQIYSIRLNTEETKEMNRVLNFQQ